MPFEPSKLTKSAFHHFADFLKNQRSWSTPEEEESLTIDKVGLKNWLMKQLKRRETRNNDYTAPIKNSDRSLLVDGTMEQLSDSPAAEKASCAEVVLAEAEPAVDAAERGGSVAEGARDVAGDAA